MSSLSLQAPKGTRDLFGKEVEAFTRLENSARHVFDLFQFSEVRTPLFESLELFFRSLGATSDVVEKEMFTFTDRGGRTFALRPEGTAGVVRFFIENKLSVKGNIHRFFYVGPMFRAERPQAGRFRQFWQIGSEHFGSAEPTADADTVLLVSQILRHFGINDFSIHVNSIGCPSCRLTYRDELTQYLKGKEGELTEESKRRMGVNPLRILDSKVDGPKLKDAPLMKDFLCEDCSRLYQNFLSYLAVGKEKVEENFRLVRGLDYYTRTVFEFVSDKLGAQNALVLERRYDELVHLLRGPQTPGVGFALGMDRVVSLAASQVEGQKVSQNGKVMVIPLMDEVVSWAFSIAKDLRDHEISVPPIIPNKKLKNQLSSAAEEGFKWVVLLGEDEKKTNEVTLKNMESREQVRVPLAQLIQKLVENTGSLRH